MLQAIKPSFENSIACTIYGCIPAKKLSLEQKLWLADQLIDKKQTATELSLQYKLTENYLFSLARRKRKGIEIHEKDGRPVGTKNKQPSVKRKKKTVRTTPVGVMPGMTEVPFPLVIEAVATPTISEPTVLRRTSTRLAVDRLDQLGQVAFI